MNQRAYTIDEIDQMREAIGTLVCLKYEPPTERDNAVEMRLRTYMMAGIEPKELQEKADQFERTHLLRLMVRPGRA